jgi:hypothetical protein
MVYGGRFGPAAARMGELLNRARDIGAPSALCWAHYVSGETVADTDADGALAAFVAAIDVGSAVDNRLFLWLAHTSSVAVAADHGSPAVAFAEFGRVLEQWEDVRNEALQWWVLLNLAVLLVRVGSDRDAALLAGAVRAARDHQPTLPRDEARLDATLNLVRDRIGATATDAAMAEGAALPFPVALAYARDAVRTAAPPRT